MSLCSRILLTLRMGARKWSGGRAKDAPRPRRSLGDSHLPWFIQAIPW